MHFMFDTVVNSLLAFQSSMLHGDPKTAISAFADSRVVTLKGYGSFQGIQINETLTRRPLPRTIDSWLGIDYALQPVGDRRFLPVTGQPEPFEGIKPAIQYGKVCVQDPNTIDKRYEQDETCLNFNVFRTPGVPLDQLLPTLVWIHGGGFVAGSARSMDGAAFVASSKEPIAVVTFNHRLNSLGFLPSKLFADEKLLNLGLRDQRRLLHFLHKHLSAFGGDAKQITLGGRSAGAHATAFQYFHNYGADKGKPLFARAIFQSGAVTARAFPNATYPLNERYFERFMTHLKCPTDDNKAALSCLRKARIEDIQYISAKMYDEAESNLSWPFQPTRGGPYLEKAGSISGLERTFHHVPAITSSTTDEGKFYTRGDLRTNDDFISLMHDISPGLNYTDMAIMNELYPDPNTHPNSLYSDSPNSTQYNRLSAAWSDYAYICPSRETAERVSGAGVPIWKLRFNTPNHPLEYQSWRGIPHTSDTAYTYDSLDVAFKDTAHIYHAYLASFVAKGDPNARRWPGSPRWPTYQSNKRFNSNPLQIVVNPGMNTVIEEDTIRVAQCEFWNDIGRMQRMNK